MARVRASGLLAIDTSSATASLDKLIAKFSVSNRAVTDFSNVVGIFNDVGKLVGATFQAASAAGTKFGVTINDVNGRMVAHVTSAVKVKDSINQLDTAYKTIISRNLNQAFQLNVGASVENMEKLRRTFNDFFSGLKGGREQVGFVNQALTALTTGQGVESLTGQAEKYYRKLFDVRTQLNAINEETTKSLAKAAPKVITPQQRGEIAAQLQTSFGAIPRGTPEEIENLRRKFIDLLNVLGTGPNVINRLQQGIQQLSVKDLGNLSPELARVRRELADYLAALGGVGAASEKARAAAAKVRSTTLTPSQEKISSDRLTKEFASGGIAIRSTAKELENVQRKTVDVQRELAKLGSVDALKNLTVGLRAAKDSAVVIPIALQPLRERIIDLGVAYTGLGETARKSADVQAAANKKAADSLQAQKDKALLTAGREAEAKVAGQMVQEKFPDLFKNVEGRQLETLRVRLGRVVSDVAKGKISLTEFAVAIEQVQKAGTKGAIIDIQAPNVEETISKLQRMAATLPDVQRNTVTASQAISNSWREVVGGFNSVVTAFRNIDRISDFLTNAAKAGADFSQSIALIRTLAQDAGDSTDQWADAVKDLSITLALPSADIAKGAYEGLSNQIFNNVDQFRVMGQAIGELSVVTGSTFVDSIDTVSGVLNSFQLDTSQTQDVVNQLFATIDLGKVKMSDLKDSIGRVGPFAQALSLETEELFGMLASLTRQGVTSSVAMTEVGQAMNAMAKPSEELQRILERLGFPTARQAIDAMGFLNFVKEIQRVTKGAPEELAKGFQELRGQKAFQGITGEFLPGFENDIKRIKDAMQVTKGAIDEVFKNPGQEFRIELEKINRFFLEEWNTKILTGIVDGGKAFGSFSDVVKGSYKNISDFGIPLAGSVASLKILTQLMTLFGKETTLATFAVASFNTTTKMGLLGIGSVAFVGVIAGFEVMTRLLERIDANKIENIKEAMDEATNSANKLNAEFKKTQDAQGAGFLAGVEAMRKSKLSEVATARVNVNENKNDIIKQGIDIAEAIKDTFKRVSLTAEREINNLQRAAENALKNSKQALQNIGDARVEAAGSLFERNIARIERGPGDEYAKEQAIVNLAKQRLATLGQIRQELEQSKDPEKVQKINDLFTAQREIMESIAGRSTEITDQYTGQKYSIDAVAGVERDILKLEQERARVMRQVAAEEQANAVAAQASADAKKKQLDEAGEAIRALAEFSIYDKKGQILPEFNPKSEGDLERALATVQALQDKVREKTEPIALAISDRITIESSFAQKMKEITEVLQKQMDNVAQGIDNSRQAAALDDLDTAINKSAATTVANYDVAKNKVKEINEEKTKELTTAIALAQIVEKSALQGSFFGDPYDKTRESVQQLIKDMESAGNSAEALTEILKRATSLRFRAQEENTSKRLIPEQPGTGIPSETIVDVEKNKNVVQTFNEIVEALQRVREKQIEQEQAQAKVNVFINPETVNDTKLKAAQIEVELERLKQIANTDDFGVKMQPAHDALNGVTNAVPPVNAAIGTLSDAAATTAAKFPAAVQPIYTTLAEIRAASEATARALLLNPTVTTPVGKAAGGLIKYFAAGGMARGIDRQMIMAADGEFIVNPASTRRFLPQLVQLNRGQAPTFNNKTSNTSVGDINITITGYEGPKQTVREIGAQLRREIRRGTIKF